VATKAKKRSNKSKAVKRREGVLPEERPKTNAPESAQLTPDDVAVFEDARHAVLELKRTFQNWIRIGHAVVRAREIADRSGDSEVFWRVLDQQGLGRILNKRSKSKDVRPPPNHEATAGGHGLARDPDRRGTDRVGGTHYYYQAVPGVQKANADTN
jgi:hypothetical protein